MTGRRLFGLSFISKEDAKKIFLKYNVENNQEGKVLFMKNRKKAIVMMSVVLAVLAVVGIVIGVSKAKKQKELEEQGIYYQDGAESVEEWDDEDLVEAEDGMTSEDDSSEVSDNSNSDINNSSDKTNKNDNSSKDDKSGKDKSGNDKSGNDKSGKDKSGNDKSGTDKSTSDDKKDDNKEESDDKKPAKVPEAGKSTYEQYMSMTPEEQQKYFESFESEQAFFDWYRKAKEEYDKNYKGNEIDGGSIDIGDYMD